MNFDQVLELVKTVSNSDLTTFQYEEGNQRIVMQTGNVVYNNVTAEGCLTGTGALNGNMAANSMMTGSSLTGTASSDGNMAGNGSVSGGAAADSVAKQTEAAPAGNLVCSPLVGRFFTAPSEDAEAFVKVGDTVKKGQVLAIVEAMKLMNEIECDYDGVVTEILAENGQSVEFGQPLFCIA